MSITQGFTMILKIIFAFCIFQVIFGQDEDLEQELQDFITQSNTEARNYTNQIIYRSKDFEVTSMEEFRRLQDEELNLQAELQTLAIQLNNGTVDFDSCLSPALEQVTQIFQDRRNEIGTFRQEEYDDVYQLYDQINDINGQELDLILDTEVQIRECRALGTTAQVNNCIAQLFSSFNVMHDDILNIIIILHENGQAVFDTIEGKFQVFANDNTKFIEENQQIISEQLTECIQNL